MRQKSNSTPVTSEKLVRDIRRATRKHYLAEEKIRIILDGPRGETPIAGLCRREGIAESMYYSWSKEFLEAGKRRLAGDSSRDGARRRFLLFDRSLGCRSPSLLPKQDTLSASRSRAQGKKAAWPGHPCRPSKFWRRPSALSSLSRTQPASRFGPPGRWASCPSWDC